MLFAEFDIGKAGMQFLGLFPNWMVPYVMLAMLLAWWAAVIWLVVSFFRDNWNPGFYQQTVPRHLATLYLDSGWVSARSAEQRLQAHPKTKKLLQHFHDALDRHELESPDKAIVFFLSWRFMGFGGKPPLVLEWCGTHEWRQGEGGPGHALEMLAAAPTVATAAKDKDPTLVSFRKAVKLLAELGIEDADVSCRHATDYAHKTHPGCVLLARITDVKGEPS